MPERRAFLLAVVLSLVWRRGSASNLYPDSVEVAVQGPPSSLSLDSCVEQNVVVRFYEIIVKGSDSNAVYRRFSVYDASLTFGSNGTTDFNAADVYQCAKEVAAEGLGAFSFDGNCTGYSLHRPFFNCDRGEFVLYVRTDHFNDELAVVPFGEAPREAIMGDGPRPDYLFMARDFILTNSAKFMSESCQLSVDPFFVTATRGNEDFLKYIYYYMDAKNCLTDNANGVPLYMEDTSVEFISVTLMTSAHFLNECGNTLQANAPSGPSFLLYSHAGLGCTYYPADAPDKCTVTVNMDNETTVNIITFSANDYDKCGGIDMNITAWSTTSMETEVAESCDEFGAYKLNEDEIFDRLTISILKRPLTPVIGFILETH